MNFKFGKAGDMRLLPVLKGALKVGFADELYQYLKDKEIFKGDEGEVYSNILPATEKVLLLGLGEEKELTVDSLRNSFFKAGKELMKLKVESLYVEIPRLANIPLIDVAQAMAEGLLQSEYGYEKYISKKKVIPSIKEVNIEPIGDKEEQILDGIQEVKNIIEGIFLARDLVNEPAMTMTPEILAKSAKDELEELGIQVDVYDREKIKELNMEAFLAVSEGSSKEPRLITMNYGGDPDSNKRLALVGKGLTFDSGGYCIKPATGMDTMFTDMAGAASVIGAMKSIAKSKIKKNVVAIVAACENLISGAAYKPGDIIGSMSGKTIEVLNTDAEGRLTLADALWYAIKNLKVDKVIDVATLTGACIVALGNINTGAITNNEELLDAVKKAGETAGEPIWGLPNNDEYKEMNKGKFADLKNIGGSGAGTITAGLFLGEFVGDTPWVHLDIAGTSYIADGRGYLPKGASGVPVKTLYYLAKTLEV